MSCVMLAHLDPGSSLSSHASRPSTSCSHSTAQHNRKICRLWSLSRLVTKAINDGTLSSTVHGCSAASHSGTWVAVVDGDTGRGLMCRKDWPSRVGLVRPEGTCHVREVVPGGNERADYRLEARARGGASWLLNVRASECVRECVSA